MSSVARRLGVAFLLALAACTGERAGHGVRVTIPPGASVDRIADILETRNVIASPARFRWYVRLGRHDRDLQAGVFDLRTNMSVSEVVTALTRGRVALEAVTVREAMMLRELEVEVREVLSVPPDDWERATRDSALRARVGARGPTLEGYLYPTTYFVRVGADASEIVTQMVDEFERHWDPAWNARLDTLGMSRDEIVTLASIIEGEVRHGEDGPYVSSVYHNRLGRHMRLQADPTVIYALGRRRRLFLRDYEIRSPFNTYRIDGLPPHPIGQPSAASLKAALYPARTDFLYFVAGSDGRHVFSRTYREHRAAIRTIRD